MLCIAGITSRSPGSCAALQLHKQVAADKIPDAERVLCIGDFHFEMSLNILQREYNEDYPYGSFGCMTS